VCHGLIVALLKAEFTRRGWIEGRAQGANGMVFGFTAKRPMCLAAALLIICWVSGARAEEASSPASEQQPAATPSPSPSGQKGGAGRGTAATPSPAAEQHRLPPDSTTKQTLALPGRTLDFTATAGSIRLFDDKGESQADIAYTS